LALKQTTDQDDISVPSLPMCGDAMCGTHTAYVRMTGAVARAAE